MNINISGWNKRYQNLKLSTRITLTFISAFIPIIVVVCIWLGYVAYNNTEYKRLVANTSVISDFSLDFKENFDYNIYLLIAGNVNFTVSDPMDSLEEAEKILDSIDLQQESAQSRQLIYQNKKYLKKLRGYVKELEDNIAIGGKYDENQKIWENDVMTVTSLIQENLMNILHNETKAIAGVRQKMSNISDRLIVISCILTIFTLVYGAVMSVTIARTITKPVHYLQNVTKKVADGDLEVHSELQTGAEIKMLSDSINQMIDQINHLFQRVKLEQIHLREAQLEILQMQINPHFLYNTLDTIVWLAEAGKQSEVVHMVESLSDFFRVSLNQGNDVATVKEELLHITSYLEIQQVRYQDILDYEIDVPEELQGYMIPKITLQPLVENALYHGIKNKRGKGCIRVSGYSTQQDVVILVHDNGIGMTRERLHQIKEGLRHPQEKKDFYGLFNVNERLRLKFGDAFQLEFYSVYREGTTIEVHLPKDRAEDFSDFRAGNALRQAIHEGNVGDC